jgi:hypothetical protein
MFDIRVDDLTGEAVRPLLALHLGGMHENSPPGHVFALDQFLGRGYDDCGTRRSAAMNWGLTTNKLAAAASERPQTAPTRKLALVALNDGFRADFGRSGEDI